MDPFTQFFSALPIDQIGYAALVTLAVVAILKGWLYPKSVVTELRDSYNKSLAESNKEKELWRTAYFTEKEASSKKDDQIIKLYALAETSAHVLDSLPTVESDKDEVV